MSEARVITIEIAEGLAQEAEALGLDVGKACREGFALAMYRKRRELEWIEEHKAAMEAYNRWIEENGLPLERYRIWPATREPDESA